jgi:NADP-dependent aldehyde dehydrogenase
VTSDTEPTVVDDVSSIVERVVSGACDAAAALAESDLNARAALLRRLADALDADSTSLAIQADEETGLGVVRLEGEVARTSGQLRLFAHATLEGSWLEVTLDSASAAIAPRRPDLRRMLIPLGPVAVFSASNFPFAFSVLGGDTASSLAAGCPVVVKAHSGHPTLSQRVAAIAGAVIREAGFPPGTLSLISGQEEGRRLVRHPGIRAGAFTGSQYAGRILFDLAAARSDPIPFYGELGSLNPVVVGPVRSPAAARTIAEGLIASFTMGQGQFCTKPGVVFLPAGTEVPGLVSELLSATGARLLTTSIATAFDSGVQKISNRPGVRRIARGVADTDAAAGGLVPRTPPTVFVTDVAAVLVNQDVLLEECFGPSTVLVEYRDPHELRDALALIPGSLTATVHADDADLGDLVPVIEMLRSRAGRVIFNGWPTGVAVTWSMHHGGPWPATTNALFTSVGVTAMRRFLRPVVYQDAPAEVLPAALRDDNPWHIPRRIDGVLRLPD